MLSKVKPDASCLKQDKITFAYGNIVKTYIFYETNLWNCVYDDYLVVVQNAGIDKNFFDAWWVWQKRYNVWYSYDFLCV